jgi:hypothetical protein
MDAVLHGGFGRERRQPDQPAQERVDPQHGEDSFLLPLDRRAVDATLAGHFGLTPFGDKAQVQQIDLSQRQERLQPLLDHAASFLASWGPLHVAVQLERCEAEAWTAQPLPALAIEPAESLSTHEFARHRLKGCQKRLRLSPAVPPPCQPFGG